MQKDLQQVRLQKLQLNLKMKEVASWKNQGHQRRQRKQGSQRSYEDGIKAFSNESPEHEDERADGFVEYVLEPPSIRSNYKVTDHQLKSRQSV